MAGKAAAAPPIADAVVRVLDSPFVDRSILPSIFDDFYIALASSKFSDVLTLGCSQTEPASGSADRFTDPARPYPANLMPF